MNRICIEKASGKLIEMQSGGYDFNLPESMPLQEKEGILETYRQLNLNILLQNAINAGHKAEDIEVRFIDDEEWRGIYAQEIAPQVEAKQEKEAIRTADINAVLPTWAQAEMAIDEVSTLAEAKAVLKKLARVVYWLAKNSQY